MRYRIILKDKVDKKLLREIQSKHGMDIEGISKLYDLLVEHGTCDSNKASRIYYVAYTLALRDIEMIIVQLNWIVILLLSINKLHLKRDKDKEYQLGKRIYFINSKKG